jgi:hypothetical protein
LGSSNGKDAFATKDDVTSGDVKPAAQGDFTGNLAGETVGGVDRFPAVGVRDEAMGAASLGFRTFHTNPNANGSPRSVINPFDGMH